MRCRSAVGAAEAFTMRAPRVGAELSIFPTQPNNERYVALLAEVMRPFGR